MLFVIEFNDVFELMPGPSFLCLAITARRSSSNWLGLSVSIRCDTCTGDTNWKYQYVTTLDKTLDNESRHNVTITPKITFEDWSRRITFVFRVGYLVWGSQVYEA